MQALKRLLMAGVIIPASLCGAAAIAAEVEGRVLLAQAATPPDPNAVRRPPPRQPAAPRPAVAPRQPAAAPAVVAPRPAATPRPAPTPRPVATPPVQRVAPVATPPAVTRPVAAPPVQRQPRQPLATTPAPRRPLAAPPPTAANPGAPPPVIRPGGRTPPPAAVIAPPAPTVATPPPVVRPVPGAPPVGRPLPGANPSVATPPPATGPIPPPPVLRPATPGAPPAGVQPLGVQPRVVTPPGAAPGIPGQPPVARPGIGTQPLPGTAAPVAPRITPGAPLAAQPGIPQQPPRRRSNELGKALAIGAGVAIVGAGVAAAINSRRIDDVRGRRQELREDGVFIVREPGRVMVRDERGRLFVQNDEFERYRDLGGDVRTERQGDELVTIYRRPDGTRVVTVTDENGRLIRRVRRTADGREVIIINNGTRRPGAFFDEVVELPPMERMTLPRERYVVDVEAARPEIVYEALAAEPVTALPQRYTLDQVRHSPQVRARMPSVDINSVIFESGSWEIPPAQAGKLAVIAEGIKRALTANPGEVFLIEGHSDSVGPDVDNLSLSDRRAQAVAALLTSQFAIPPENLTAQGYGEQYPKVNVQGAAPENRRVTVRRITPLLGQQGG